MHKRISYLAIFLFFIANSSFCQWYPAATTANTWREGNVGIGTSLITGHLSFGVQGDHLTIGRSGFTNKVILRTDWAEGGIGDFTDIRVPGAVANTAFLRLTQFGKVGIGVENPAARLDVRTAGNSPSDQYGLFVSNPSAGPYAAVEITMGSGANSFATLHAQKVNATKGSILIFQTTDVNGNNLPRMVVTESGNVGIGTLETGTFKLAVEGTIGARKVKVTQANPWPDYVFDSAYKKENLLTLEKYINEHKHLPGVPSADQVKKDGGIELGEMNVKLLEKIEELTLYVIDLKKENEQMKKEIKELKVSAKH